MRFLPENKKKTIVYIAIVGVSLIAIVYLNFFARRQAIQPVSPTLPEGAPTVSAGAARGGLLPHGNSIKTQILQDDKFTILKRPPGVSVEVSELGKTNLFVAE